MRDVSIRRIFATLKESHASSEFMEVAVRQCVMQRAAMGISISTLLQEQSDYGSEM